MNRLFVYSCLFWLLQGCVVGKKKYLAELSARQAAELALADCQRQLANANQQNEMLTAELDKNKKSAAAAARQADERIRQLESEVAAKRGDLTGKEKLLAEREAKVRELQALIARKDSIVGALKNKIVNALAAYPKDELSVSVENGKVYVSLAEKLLFQSGRTDVDSRGQKALKSLAEVLSKNPDIGITIEGHTDSIPIKTPRFEDNWDLSVLRATSIIRILMKNQVEPTQITAAGRGPYFPIDENSTPEGRARNRRTEIILTPKLDELFELFENQDH